MRGYSHIFVSGPTDAPECSDFVTVAEAEQSWQEVFSRARLREVVTSYWKDTNPTAIRKAIAGEDIWSTQTYRTPSKRIQIVQRPSTDGDSPNGGATPGAGPSGPQPPPIPPAPTPASSAATPPSTPPAPVTEPAPESASLWAYPKIGELVANYSGGTQDSAADVRIGIEFPCDVRRERIEFDPREPRLRAHLLRHQPKEMPDAHRRFQYAAMLEAKPFHRFINGAHHHWRGVVGIERRGTRRLIFLIAEECLQPLPLRLPVGSFMPREDLRNAAPANVFDQHSLLLVGRRPPFSVEFVDQFNRRKVVAAFLLERTLTHPVLRTDAVVTRV